MRIAQVAPLMERVPPPLYGATERVVYALTEALVRRGHDLTLFASGDSSTSARLVPMSRCGLRLSRHPDPWLQHRRMFEEVLDQARHFDVIHFHCGHAAYPYVQRCAAPALCTVHGRLDAQDHQAALRRYPGLPLVSISDSQRSPVRHLPLNWRGTVHNGLHLPDFPVRAEPNAQPYLLFLGRINEVKGPDLAIEVARRAGVPLKVAAKIDEILDAPWAAEHFLPLLNGPGVEFLGEVGGREKAELLGGALALLFPIRWPEPFGLVMVEAMACGTPVIALRGGAVEEVLLHGQTGYICDSLDEMVQAVARVGRIDRGACRRHVERHFSAAKMAERYEAVYRGLLDELPCPNRLHSSASTLRALD